MKHHLIVCVLLLAAIGATAQRAFERKTNVLSFGGDLGLYGYRSKIASQPTSKTNGALNRMLNLQYEHSLGNWFGVGVKLQYCNYFATKDSVTLNTPSFKSLDGMLVLNAHWLRTRRVDFLTGINLGYSHAVYSANDNVVSEASGGGFTFDLHLQPRFYFGKHIGMFINLAYVNYNYGDMDFRNQFTQLDDVIDLRGGGINLGVGLQAKF